MKRVFWALLLTLTGCAREGSASERDASLASQDGGAASPDDAQADDPWAPVDQAVRAALSESPDVPGVSLLVYDASDTLRFAADYGSFARDERVAVASASKLVAGTVIFALIGEGKLSLDDTTAAVLGWAGEKGSITLRHLLSFTSGLGPEARCTIDASLTLEACVAEIEAAETLAAPGLRFDYGSTHLHVAARMAEVMGGASWNELFRARLADPLGLPDDVRYYTQPRRSAGQRNPLVAGGLRASTEEYARLLAVVFHAGVFEDVKVGTEALFEAQARQPFDVTIESSPMNASMLRYGLTAWLECATPVEGCARISSPGAFGFQPWLDRAHGYYAVLGMQLPYEEGEAGAFSGGLASELKPLIEAAL